MSVIFKPNGTLNIATAPTDLTKIIEGNTIIGLDFVRCKNLRLDRSGLVSTRYGIAKTHATAIETPIHHLEEQAGNRYVFGGTQIYKNEKSIATDLTSARWSSFKYNAFNDTTQQIFALNGTDRKRIDDEDVFEWGVTPPTDTPVASLGQTSVIGVSGAYRVKITYVRKEGSTVVYESNPGTQSNSVTLSIQGMHAFFDRPNDTAITHIRVYRTLTNASAFFLDADFATPFVASEYDFAFTYSWEGTDGYISGTGNDITTADFVQNVSTLSGGGAKQFEYLFSWELDTTKTTFDNFAASGFIWEPVFYCTLSSDGELAAEVDIDHDRPPTGNFCIGPSYNGTVFVLKDNNLHYSLPKQPEYFPVEYFVEVSNLQFPGKSALFFNGQLYVLTKKDLILIQGTSHGTFFPVQLAVRGGVAGARGAISVSGYGIFRVLFDGIYLYSAVDRRFTDKSFGPLFKGESINGIPAIASVDDAWLAFFNNNLYFAYTSEGNTAPSNLIVTDMDTNRSSYYNYNDGSEIQISTIGVDSTNDKFFVCDATGFVREIENDTETKDETEAIDWEVQSGDMTLQTRKHFPRWIKYDVNGTATGSIILDDEIVQTHAVTGDRKTKRRLIASENGSRVSLKLTGSGVVDIYAMEME